VLANTLRGGYTSDATSTAYMVVLTLTLIAPWKRANVAGLAALVATDIWAFLAG